MKLLCDKCHKEEDITLLQKDRMDWKEVDIISYLELEEEKTAAEREMVNNPAIAKLQEKRNAITEEMNVREFGYRANIHNCESAMHSIKEKLIKEWDIEDKTFKCDVGTATVRTTKSLIVTDNFGLIDRLTEILGSGVRACECIRTFELSTIRKYMDADLFAKDIAHYDEKKNVIIRDVKNGRNSENGG